jgi:hypothetical protein
VGRAAAHHSSDGGSSSHGKEQRVPKGNVETYFEDDVWKNRIEGNLIEHSVYERKVTAILVGSDLARSRKVEHIIRNEDGTISERNNYGNGVVSGGGVADTSDEDAEST